MPEIKDVFLIFSFIYLLTILLVSVVSFRSFRWFRWFRFVVSGFSTCPGLSVYFVIGHSDKFGFGL